jgi:spermidine/putrescine transport system permease protein
MEARIGETPLIRWAAGIVTLFALAFIYVPPLYLLLLSFNPGLLPTVPSITNLSLRWYVALLGEQRMLVSLRESLLIGATTAIAATLVALPAALAFMELKRGRAAWFNFVVLSMFVPGVVQGLVLSVVFNVLNIPPSRLTVIAGHMLWALPFAFIVILTNLAMLKRNLLLAAHDLGASWVRTFLDIILPLIRPGIVGALTFSFLLSFNEFDRAFYLVGANDTLPIYMFGVMRAGTSPTIYSLAGSKLLLSLLCVALMLPLMLRRAVRT